jgi:hypothetical protein
VRIKAILIGSFALAVLTVIPAKAGIEVTASKSLTIQPGGPRSGENGSKYFNIEGKDNKQYASFGVLIFEINSKSWAQKNQDRRENPDRPTQSDRDDRSSRNQLGQVLMRDRETLKQ